jgi:BASS family bile acid:Na+ symporter
VNAAALIPLALKLSITLIVFGLGLRATFADATWLFRQPGMLVRSVLGMNVILPLFAVALAVAFDLPPAVKIALILIAVCPVPPILPKKQMKGGGDQPYVYGLVVAAAVLSIVLVPLTVAAIGAWFGRELAVPPRLVLDTVLQTILVPLTVGMLINILMPKVAARLAPIAGTVGSVLLLAAIPILVIAWPAITSLVGNGSVGAIVAFVIAALVIGHLLGGPDEDNKTTLALAGASRHPGLAIAIANATFPGQKLVPAAVLLYLLVSAVVTLPYVNLRKRRHAAAGTPRPLGH